MTIAINTDYTVANSTITDFYYSKELTPVGYPQWFTFAPTYTGYSVVPTGPHRFKLDGRCMTVVYSAGGGTSNSTSKSATLPVTAVTISGMGWQGCLGITINNGSLATTPGTWDVGSASTSVTFYINNSRASWTASGSCQVNGIVEYEV